MKTGFKNSKSSKLYRLLTRQWTGRLALLLVACVGGSSAAVAQEPSIRNEVDRESVYLGDQIIYSVQVNNLTDAVEPEIGELGFGVEQLPSSTSSRMSMVQDGNRVRRTVQQSITFQYRLTPRAAGEFTIPAPSVTVAGKTLTGKPISVTVAGPDEQYYVTLETSVDKEYVYPLQPFTVTLKIAVKQPQGKFAGQSPLSIQPREPVRLSVPWLMDEGVPGGLEPRESVSDILRPLISSNRRGRFDGMAINDVTVESGSAFSIFADRRRGVFLPKSIPTTRKTPDGTDAGYVEYTLQRSFAPQRFGEYSLGTSSIKGIFGTDLVDGKLNAQPIYAVSQPLSVTVRDVPTQGRPNSYIGAIGKFAVDADVSPAEATVGEPLTLTLTVFGEGTVADIRAPDIARLPEFSEKFRTYDATEKTEGNGRVFTYSLRALDADVKELPAIPVAYFDVDQEQYVSLTTSSIPLIISAAKKLATSDIVANRASTTSNPQLQVSDAGLFANHSSFQTLRATNVSLTRWMTIWITMIIGYFGISFGIRRRQRWQADPALLRRRNARGRAVEALKAVRSAAGSDERVSSEALSKIVAGLIADFTGASEAGMTAIDATVALQIAEVSQDVSQRTSAFIDQCDAARFGAGAADSATVTQECEVLIADLSRELEKRC